MWSNWFSYPRNFSKTVLLVAFFNCSHKPVPFDEMPAAGSGYYLNNSGSDTNDGSQLHPWQTISKLNSLHLKAGDTVFFRGGQTFAGAILLDSADAGTKDKPVVLTTSGTGKAIIDGGGGTPLTVYNTNYITVTQLSFRGAGRKTGNTKDGVIINACNNVVLDSVDVRGFQKSGLLINSSKAVDAKKIYATENGFAGIYVVGAWGKRDCSNIHLSYCLAENNPGDPTNFTNHSGNGILAGLCKNILIEYSSATNNGWDMPRIGNGPVGIWCYEADSVIIQNCISYKNKTAAGAADGGGFDLDGGVSNSVIQYCLSYDNQGSGYGLFQYAGAGNWFNNTVRYCISENDGSVSPAHAGVFIWNSSDDANQLKDCFFYNNVIYNTKGAAISYERQSANMGFRFYNNIFVGDDSLVIGKDTNTTYLANNWFSLKSGFNIGGIKDFSTWANTNEKEKLNGIILGLNINPQFSAPGSGSAANATQLNNFTGYDVPANSVLRKAGLDLQELFGIKNGGKSFNQHVAPEKGIGACF